jgi:hypothetical protein
MAFGLYLNHMAQLHIDFGDVSRGAAMMTDEQQRMGSVTQKAMLEHPEYMTATDEEKYAALSGLKKLGER